MSQQLSNFSKWGRKIVCVGRNFKEHCIELNNPIPTKPLIFLKPTTAYVTEGNPIKTPKNCSSLHHEVELGVVISKTGSDIPEELAMSHVGGYVLSIDLTARDWQCEAKSKGKPWSFAKGFDTSCPISNFIEKEKIVDPHNINLWLNVNGKEKQNGSTSDMIFSIPYLISFISNVMTLEQGDVILTGTPSGVGPLLEGDVVECGIDDIIKMTFDVASK